ncbi:MAG TPA: NAD(P)-binding protein, partial [Planctomycetota bacterium]|nr:NAD(P)-binding protein [Planctomycetota bacterium]
MFEPPGPTRRAFVAAALCAPAWRAPPGFLRDGPPAAFVGEAVARGHRARGAAEGRRTPDAEARRAVVVIGAGFAGLAAARRLVAEGVDDVEVLELDDVAGGLAQRRVVGGVSTGFGPQALEAAVAEAAASAPFGAPADAIGSARPARTRRRAGGEWTDAADAARSRLVAAAEALA